MLSLDLSKVKIEFSIKCLGNILIEDSLSTVIFMNVMLAFAKALKSCVVLKSSCLIFQKVAFYKQQLLIVLPNAYIIYLVSKSTFCLWKVQTNEH